MKILLTILFLLSLVFVKAQAPTVSAGFDQAITSPTTSVVMAGTATGNGGHTIASKRWIQLNGPNLAIVNDYTAMGMPDLSNGISSNSFTQYFDSPATWLSKCTPALLQGYYNHGVRNIRMAIDPKSTYDTLNFDSLNMPNMVKFDTIAKRWWAINPACTITWDFTHLLGGWSFNLFDSAYTLTSPWRTGAGGGYFRRTQKALYNHCIATNPDTTKWAFEIWNEPKDPGVANVQSECYNLQDSIVMDLDAINPHFWKIATGTGSTLNLAGMNVHIANAYKVPKIPSSHVIYNFHGYLPDIFYDQGHNNLNNRGTYNLPHWWNLTEPEAQKVGDSLNTFDLVGANGNYNNTGVGTKGQIWTITHTQIWNLSFMDSSYQNAAQTGINYGAPMTCTEYMQFQNGDGKTTGTLRDYRLNMMEDFNATMNKYAITANAWDPQGSRTRIDSNMSITTPIFDTALLRKMGYLGRASITDQTNLTTTIKNLIPGTYTFRLIATDNAGNTSTDDMEIIVNTAAIVPNCHCMQYHKP